METGHIAIAGGGPAGAVAAIELARAGFRVSVYESSPRAEAKVGETLPPNAMAVLRRLNLVGADFEATHLPSQGIRCVWGSDAPVDRDFLFECHGPGWHLDRRRFEQTLAQIARGAGVEWHVGSTVRFPNLSRGRWRFFVNGREQSADALMDATGRTCSIARALGVRRIYQDRLVGIVRAYEPAGGSITDSFTLIEAAPDGWWYSAVVPDGKLMIIYFTDADLPGFRQARELRGFDDLIGRTRLTADRVHRSKYGATRSPIVHYAGTSRLSRICGQGWIAIGDAASAFDPLSSYGIAHAVGSGYYAARALSAGGAMQDYEDLIEETYLTCRRGVSFLYNMEPRWSTEPFWIRRRAAQPNTVSGQVDGKRGSEFRV